jgi:hypothetical protein
VDHEDLHTCPREPFEPLEEAKLRAQPTFGSVVDVTGDGEECGLGLDAQIDERVEGIEGRLAERAVHRTSRIADALERRVEV